MLNNLKIKKRAIKSEFSFRVVFGFLFLFSVLLISCVKKELPVLPHNSGSVITASVNMTSYYKWQLFYNLKSNSVVSKNLKTSWDLAFESGTGGYRIILNSSKAMYAGNTGLSNFASISDTNGFSIIKKFDAPSGAPDSSAIGDWRSKNRVYIIDRGYSEMGTFQGLRKIQFQTVDANTYTIRLSELNGNGDTTLVIKKDSLYNFTFLSFTTKSTVIVEPPKADWDIVFTQYLEAIPEAYLVTGVLLNRYGTYAIMDSSKLFSQISFTDAINYNLITKLNTIGYTWKYYDNANSTYTVFPQMNYIIRDNKGIYYKLHFIDFYDSGGNKGSPKWEQQEL